MSVNCNSVAFVARSDKVCALLVPLLIAARLIWRCGCVLYLLFNEYNHQNNE